MSERTNIGTKRGQRKDVHFGVGDPKKASSDSIDLPLKDDGETEAHNGDPFTHTHTRYGKQQSITFILMLT